MVAWTGTGTYYMISFWNKMKQAYIPIEKIIRTSKQSALTSWQCNTSGNCHQPATYGDLCLKCTLVCFRTCFDIWWNSSYKYCSFTFLYSKLKKVFLPSSIYEEDFIQISVVESVEYVLLPCVSLLATRWHWVPLIYTAAVHTSEFIQLKRKVIKCHYHTIHC